MSGDVPGLDAHSQPVPADKLRVFISYSRQDIAFADQLDATLDLGGFDCTLDRHGIHGAEAWQEKLGSLIREADTILFVLTPASAASEICAWEVEQATVLGKRIIPVVPRPMDNVPAPPRLSALNYIFFYDEPKKPGSGFRSGLADLVKALKTDLGWMRDHTRYLTRAIEWETGGRQSNRLLSGEDISEAKGWVARKPKEAPPPTELHLAFIKASEAWEVEQTSQRARQLEEREHLVRQAEADRTAREAAQRNALDQARRVTHRTMMGLVAALVLALLAGVIGVDAWQQRQAAIAQTNAAEARKQETQRLREQTQKTESGLLANAAAAQFDKNDFGDSVTAALLALEALPDQTYRIFRPFIAEAQVQLDRAFRSQSERTLFAHDGRVRSAQFNADGTRVVTASDDKTARLWDAATGKELSRLAHDAEVSSAQFSADGSRIVTASNDKTARLWDAATGRELGRLVHDGAVNSAQFSADGTHVVTASGDRTARVWDAVTGNELGRLGHRGYVVSAQFNADGTRVVTASWDYTAGLWDAVTGQQLSLLKHDHLVVRSARFSADGARVVTASDDRTARVWEVATGKEIGRLAHDGTVWNAQFSADGTRIVTASHDKTARVWDATTGKELARFVHDETVTSVQFIVDSTRLVVTTSLDTARLWDADTGTELGRLIHDGHVLSAQFRADGTHVVTASDDKTARLWDAATGKELSRLAHDGAINTAQFNADGTRVVTASDDKTARLWDATTGEELGRLAHDGGVESAEFSADSLRIVTASSGTAHIWQAFPNTQALVNATKDRLRHCLTQKQRAQYFLSLAPPLWCVERRLWPYHSDAWQAWLSERKAWLANPSGPEPKLPKDATE